MQNVLVRVVPSTGLNFLQPEAYSFHLWCERAFTFAKNRITFLLLKKTNKKAQMRKGKK